MRVCLSKHLLPSILLKKPIPIFLEFLVVLCLIFVCLSSYGQPIPYNETPINTEKINQDRLSFEMNNDVIYLDDIERLLISTLNEKDTLTFNHLCIVGSYTYVDNQKLEEGAMLSKHCIKLLKDSTSIYAGQLYNVLGNCYSYLGYDLNAFECYFQSKEVLELHKDSLVAAPVVNIASLYFELGDYDKALQYGEEALSHTQQIECGRCKLYNLIYNYSLLGDVYDRLDKINLSKYYLEQSIDFAKELGDDIITLMTYEKAIRFYDKHNYPEKCEGFIRKGKLIIDEGCISSVQEEILFIITSSTYYLNTNQLSKAIDPSSFSYDGAELKEKYEYAAQFYTIHNDIENSSKYHELLKEEIERINKVNTKNVYTNVESRFKAIELEKENKELLLQTGNRERYLMIILTAFLMMLSMFLLQLYNYKKTKKLNASLQLKTIELEETNEDLIVSNEELERFAHIASHDLKTPLHNIIKFSGLL